MYVNICSQQVQWVNYCYFSSTNPLWHNQNTVTFFFQDYCSLWWQNWQSQSCGS
jgi:hypothetical protein